MYFEFDGLKHKPLLKPYNSDPLKLLESQHKLEELSATSYHSLYNKKFRKSPLLSASYGVFGPADVDVNEKDIDGTASKMLDFVENRDQCSKMGLKGREHIEMNFDNSKLNDKLVNIYEKIGVS